MVFCLTAFTYYKFNCIVACICSFLSFLSFLTINMQNIKMSGFSMIILTYLLYKRYQPWVLERQLRHVLGCFWLVQSLLVASLPSCIFLFDILLVYYSGPYSPTLRMIMTTYIFETDAMLNILHYCAGIPHSNLRVEASYFTPFMAEYFPLNVYTTFLFIYSLVDEHIWVVFSSWLFVNNIAV